MKTYLSSILLLCAFSFSSIAATKKVLFIGNSYVYVNNLPQVVADIAASTGDTLVFDANAVGGYRLMDHSVDATTLTKIAAGNWDFVVLQEQSQAPSFPIGQVQTDVLPYAHLLDSLIHVSSPCAKTLFYMTWGRKNGDASNCGSWPPVCTYLGMDSLLRERYLMMANDNHGLVAPAGPIWRKLRTNNPTIELYQSDESHPSEAGTYAIGCGFYAIIFQKNPMNISYNYTLAANDALAVRTAAKTVAYDSLAYWNVGKFLPNADFQFNTIANLQVSFTNNSQFATTYAWNFGDGNTSTQTNTVHIYAASGTYQVRLIAYKCWKLDTTIKSVTVTSTGIHETNNTVIAIYPNPVRNEMKIVGSWKNTSSIIVTNVEGKSMNVSPGINDSEMIITTEQLASGVYFLIIEKDGKEYKGKFVKE